MHNANAGTFPDPIERTEMRSDQPTENPAAAENTDETNARNDGDAALNETDARNGFDTAGADAGTADSAGSTDPNYKSADHPAA